MNLFFRANLRHLLGYPLQMALSVTGIALGVSVVLAVDLANQSALRAFRLAESAISGDATHAIVPAASAIDEAFYRELRLEHGFRHSAPRVTGTVRTGAGQTLQLVGIDPLASSNFSAIGRSPGTRIDPATLMATPGAAILTTSTAATLGARKGDRLKLGSGERTFELEVVALLSGGGALVEGLRNVAVTDIATAQVSLDKVGRLDRIDVKLDEAGYRRLQALLPESMALQPGDSRSHALEHMTRAFQINLTALSLLALLIGAFLIYNTQTLFVLSRRETFAVWRTLGITRSRIMLLVTSEALWLAVAGTLVGCLLGVALGRALLELVGRTINDLYFSIEVRSVSISTGSVAKAALLGVAAAMVATMLPALEASRARPRLALARSEAETSARRLRAAGIPIAIALWLLAGAILWLFQRSIGAGFAALFFVVTGFAFIVPAGLRVIASGAAPMLKHAFGWMGLWSARNVLACMSRTQVAVTALTVALAATVGVSVMIQSFRLTVEHWLDNYLRADIYISRPGDDATGIQPELLKHLQELPGVVATSTGRWRRLPTATEPTRLFVLDTGPRGFDNFQLLNRASREAWPGFNTGDNVIVSESYAFHRGLEPGDRLTLPTEQGPRPFEIIDLFYDYASDRGTVAMHRSSYDRHWSDDVVESIALYLEPGTDSESFLRRVEDRHLRNTGLLARSNRTIKDRSLEIFDRTFTVTEVLRVLTIVVACVGILSALVAIQLDRTREFAVLRAGGLTRGELSRLMMIEGGVMGTASAILSVPLGIALAAVLVFVINKRSFGWSMQFVLPWEQVLVALVLGLAAGTIAAIYPAWRMSRQPITSSLRYE
jgi:putative ABC transport system permease protein